MRPTIPSSTGRLTWHDRAVTGARASIIDQLADAPLRRRRLRRMKLVALGFLATSATVFGLTYLGHDRGWVGFVRAAAEAGVVGGLADWFAVTALFRRPLGLPIPHTALIPTRKDALAGTLGEFGHVNVPAIALGSSSVMELGHRFQRLLSRAGEYHLVVRTGVPSVTQTQLRIWHADELGPNA